MVTLDWTEILVLQAFSSQLSPSTLKLGKHGPTPTVIFLLPKPLSSLFWQNKWGINDGFEIWNNFEV